MYHPTQQHPMHPHPQHHHPHGHPQGGPGGNNFYDVINPSSQQGSNYYYSLRNPGSHHSMAENGNGSDQYVDGGYDQEGLYQQGGGGSQGGRSMKGKGGTGQKTRTRKKKARTHGDQQHHHHQQGVLPGLITEGPGGSNGLPQCLDANNFDNYESEVAKRGSGNKMLVDDNGFVRFKEFEERNNDSGIMLGGGEYGEQQQQQMMHPGGGLETMGSKRRYDQQQQRTPYHQSQMPGQHPSSSHELNDFFGGNVGMSDSGNVGAVGRE